MGRSFDAIPDHLVAWMEEQPIYFVASAPLDAEGHVNVSPKGGDSFRVLGPNAVAYLDLTGSGAETIAHTRENGRLTVMFCSFDEKPNIVRLFGRGEAVLPGDDRFPELAARFPANPGTRSVVTLEVSKVTSSCGYSVPMMDLVGHRDTLDRWAERKGPDGIAEYWGQKNQISIDGLPALAD
jgi:hypothetical protein